MYKLVIADDEPLMRAGLFYRNDWNSMGYEVAAVLEDGRDVLEFLEKEPADVLLLDVCMYQVSGLDVAKAVLEKYPQIKVVLLSGYKEFEYAREAMRCHVYEYLLKPVDYEQLKSVFIKIRKELDKVAHEKELLRSFGEAEYNQLVNLAKLVTGAVLGEREGDVWIVYTQLKVLLTDMPEDMKNYLFKEMLERLKSGLRKKAPDLASAFEEQLDTINLSGIEEGQSVLLEIFSDLNDKLVQQGILLHQERIHDAYIRKACSYIDNHLGDDITQKDVANFVNISPRHFTRKFSQEVGESFTEYLLRKRINCAKRLLREGNVDLADIPEAVGYHQEKHFGQLFKKYVGCSMREYQSRRIEL